MDGLKSIILVGPVGVGKSTIAYYLNRKYGIKIIEADDDFVFDYMRKNNISINHFRDIYREKGADIALMELEKICTPLFYDLFTRVASSDELVVIDTGGNKMLFRDCHNFNTINSVIQKFYNSFLLLPSNDINWSLDLLYSRFHSRVNEPENRIVLESDCYRELTHHLIYTGDDEHKIVFERVDRILHESPEMNVIFNQKAEQMILSKKNNIYLSDFVEYKLLNSSFTGGKIYNRIVLRGN